MISAWMSRVDGHSAVVVEVVDVVEPVVVEPVVDVVVVAQGTDVTVIVFGGVRHVPAVSDDSVRVIDEAQGGDTGLE